MSENTEPELTSESQMITENSESPVQQLANEETESDNSLQEKQEQNTTHDKVEEETVEKSEDDSEEKENKPIADSHKSPRETDSKPLKTIESDVTVQENAEVDQSQVHHESLITPVDLQTDHIKETQKIEAEMNDQVQENAQEQPENSDSLDTIKDQPEVTQSTDTLPTPVRQAKIEESKYEHVDMPHPKKHMVLTIEPSEDTEHYDYPEKGILDEESVDATTNVDSEVDPSLKKHIIDILFDFIRTDNELNSVL